MKKYLLILLSIVLVGLSSCVTSKKINLFQESGKHNIPEYADTLSYEDYLLRTGDRIYVRVYSVDENVMKLFNASGANSGGGNNGSYLRNSINTTNGGSYDLYTYLVMDDGCIEFPLIGKLPVRGLNTHEMKLALEKELSSYIKSYGDYQMVSCEVNVVQRSFSVISQKGTGNYPIRKEKLTIYEAIAQAGDLGDWSDRSKVKIIREIEGQTKVISFDIRSKDIIHSEYYYIEPNDVIYVQQLRGKAMGVSNAATTLSIVSSTLAFGGFVYGLVVRIMNAVKSQQQSDDGK
ncbi:MAG: polysaccharide biosynthesis/export family protein [Paludibacteraceae bacterium]|nr:polysaccharide biosynthesis/export family protein [Paludibacteraceae bacterium]